MILNQKNSIKPNVNSLKLLLILNRNEKKTNGAYLYL